MNRKMNRRILMILALMLMLLLAACGSGGADSTTLDQAPAVDVSSLPDEVDVQTVAEVKDSPDVFVLDVREQWEYDEKHIPGVTLIPMNQIPDRLDEIPTEREVIVTCRTGNRSGQVAEYLRNSGFDNVHNMSGGIVAWEAAGYPVE